MIHFVRNSTLPIKPHSKFISLARVKSSQYQGTLEQVMRTIRKEMSDISRLVVKGAIIKIRVDKKTQKNHQYNPKLAPKILHQGVPDSSRSYSGGISVLKAIQLLFVLLSYRQLKKLHEMTELPATESRKNTSLKSAFLGLFAVKLPNQHIKHSTSHFGECFEKTLQLRHKCTEYGILIKRCSTGLVENVNSFRGMIIKSTDFSTSFGKGIYLAVKFAPIDVMSQRMHLEHQCC
ncbi:hypothetical protein HUJ04_004764 [Dendroctonus ponderosae]|nr:hypothetical protein HUJ04_004764 [Dendroctonus ponderosae]